MDCWSCSKVVILYICNRFLFWVMVTMTLTPPPPFIELDLIMMLHLCTKNYLNRWKDYLKLLTRKESEICYNYICIRWCISYVFAYINFTCFVFFFFQKAIKKKNIELWEIEKDVLGTADEKVPPPNTKWY